MKTRHFLLAGFAFALALAGCHSGDTLSVGALPIDRITPFSGQPVFVSGLSQPLRMVIRDEATFSKVWTQAFGGMSPIPPLPTIDFRTQQVVVVALGSRATGGYRITVESAVADEHDVVIGVDAVSPGSGCGVPQMITAPADFVAIPISSRLVRFEDRATVHDCGD